MEKKKRIGIASFNCSHGLVWQRLHLPLRHLRHEFEFVTFDVKDIRHSDAFYLDALVLSQPWNDAYLHVIERFRTHYRIPVIIDVDDLVNELPSDHPDYLSFRTNRLNQIIQSSSHVVYSTEFLKYRLGHLNRNHSVISNSISADVYEGYKPRAKPYKNAFTVGWTGGQSHRGDQYFTFLDDLRRFLREKPDAKAYFHILCPEILLKEFGTQIIYEPEPCEFLDYPAVSATYPFDVCLVGLTDCNFNNAKSDLKLLEMAPNHIPIIASPRSDFIRHKDRNVMLYAENNKDGYKSWYEQLCWAYDNQSELKEIGKRAAEYVLTERLSTKAADEWREVLNKCVI